MSLVWIFRSMHVKHCHVSTCLSLKYLCHRLVPCVRFCICACDTLLKWKGNSAGNVGDITVSLTVFPREKPNHIGTVWFGVHLLGNVKLGAVALPL